MKSKVWFMGAVVVALGTISIYLWRHLEERDQQIEALQVRLEQPSSAMSVTLPLARVEDAMTLPEPGDAAIVRPTEQTTQMTSAASALIGQRDAGSLVQAVAGPEYDERMRTRFRAELPSRYPDIDKVLALSPDDMTQLFDVLARQEEDARRIGAHTPFGGVEASQAYTRRLQKDESELATILGSKFQAWKEYKSELPSRQQLKDLVTVLDVGGMSLNEEQAGSVLAALVATQNQINSDTVPAAEHDGGALRLRQRYSPVNNQRLVQAVTPYLTPQQVEAYQQMIERQAAMERAMLRSYEALQP